MMMTMMMVEQEKKEEEEMGLVWCDEGQRWNGCGAAINIEQKPSADKTIIGSSTNFHVFLLFGSKMDFLSFVSFL
jgi:hypothetical protein